MIHLDTSVLVDALSGDRRSAMRLRTRLARGERMLLSTLVLYEWLHGPRRREEIRAQEGLFPTETAVAFGPREAAIAADLYRAVPRARGRELDLAIAACAVSYSAALWTLNPRDFEDIPGLTLA